jgi:phosphohistidine phosphatase SixA
MVLARFAYLCVLLVLLLCPASTPAQAQPEWVAALRSGGHVIVFRHGATHQDQADTDPLNLDNVAKQRQLNDAGQAKAKEIGDAMRKMRVPVGAVHTSKIYRAIETGKLMFPDLTPMATIDLVETGQVATPLASTMPPAGTNAVAITHKPNVLDAFGKDWFDVAEGEATIAKPDGNAFRVIARVKADDWAKAAQ